MDSDEQRYPKPRAAMWVAGGGLLAIGLVAFVLFGRSASAPHQLASTAVPADPYETVQPRRLPPLAPDHPRFRPKDRPTSPLPPSSMQADASVEDRDAREAALLRNANDALDGEDYTTALREATDCIRIDPANRDCFRVELMTYGRTGDFANERILAEECLYDDPNDVTCLETIVTVDARDGDFIRARKAADLLRQLAPGTTSSTIADATIADLSGDSVTALADYERACGLGEEYACFRAQAIRSGGK